MDLMYHIMGAPGSVSFLSALTLTPSAGDVAELSFKDRAKMRLALAAPTQYGRKPRLATTRELAQVFIP